MTNGIVSFILHQLLGLLAKFDATFSWTNAKAQLDAAANAALPTFLQPMIDAAINAVVDCVALALADTADLQLVADDLIAQNWTKAIADLTALVIKVQHPAKAAVLFALQHAA